MTRAALVTLAFVLAGCSSGQGDIPLCYAEMPPPSRILTNPAFSELKYHIHQSPNWHRPHASDLWADAKFEYTTGVQYASAPGKEPKSPRKGFFYFDDDGNMVALRFDNWKMVFLEQRCQGTLRIWGEPFTVLRMPKLFNLRTDPFERADVTSNTYYDWFMWKGYMLMAAQTLAVEFMKTFKEFPPRQKAASFTIEQASDKLETVAAGNK